MMLQEFHVCDAIRHDAVVVAGGLLGTLAAGCAAQYTLTHP